MTTQLWLASEISTRLKLRARVRSPCIVISCRFSSDLWRGKLLLCASTRTWLKRSTARKRKSRSLRRCTHPCKAVRSGALMQPLTAWILNWIYAKSNRRSLAHVANATRSSYAQSKRVVRFVMKSSSCLTSSALSRWTWLWPWWVATTVVIPVVCKCSTLDSVTKLKRPRNNSISTRLSKWLWTILGTKRALRILRSQNPC